MKPPAGYAFVLTGPTASGKTETAHWLARQMGLDILSVDSMAVYRGMDIGTAKPSARQRAEVNYWGVDLIEPDQLFSLELFRQEAQRAFSAAAEKGEGLLLVGGTGLYLKALVVGVDRSSGPNPTLRAYWEECVRRHGVERLQDAVRRSTPEAWEELGESDRKNPRRLIRILERYAGGGAERAVGREWKRQGKEDPVLVALWPEPEIVRRRIEKRVQWMYSNGLIEEVRALRERGLFTGATAAQAIGYAEALGVVEGRWTVEEAKTITVRRTWQLYRRQRTWFRHQAKLRTVAVDEDDPVEAIAARVVDAWRETGPIRLRGVFPVE